MIKYVVLFGFRIELSFELIILCQENSSVHTTVHLPFVSCRTCVKFYTYFVIRNRFTQKIEYMRFLMVTCIGHNKCERF